MTTGKNSLKFGDVNVLDTTLIYSCVIALLLTNKFIPINHLFSFELAPVLTSMLDEFGEIRLEKSKAKFTKLLFTIISSRNTSKPDLAILDDCAILMVVY